MKDKGFTLIELLAVIVILAIIALIAVPIIIDIIEDSKKEAQIRSAENYLKAVELAIAKENLNGEFNPTSCQVQADGNLLCDGYDNPLNVTVDGEKPEGGTIRLEDGKIEKTSLTTLTYKSVTVTYDSNGKLTIESPKEELIAEGVIITETTSGLAVNVDNQLVYYVPVGSNEATVYGYKGNVDYSNTINLAMTVSQTSGDIEIASKVKINGVIYDVTSIKNNAFSSFFDGNANITSIIIPSSVTSIGSDAFENCTNLSSIIIPSSVTSIGLAAFAGNMNITSVIIPSSVTSIENGVFSACANLASITIPSSVTNIGPMVFDGTPWLESQKASAPNGFVIINNILIDGTNATGDVIIPNGVTSIVDQAFFSMMGGSTITSVTIPSSVTSIGDGAFINFVGVIININKPSGSIEGAPWGAISDQITYGPATVNWLG
ncbi:MAG: leucine-rich repeat domain-containing protein [bacterium]|nr:leucine-rich repeat domain-containing protein [bacterium]